MGMISNAYLGTVPIERLIHAKGLSLQKARSYLNGLIITNSSIFKTESDWQIKLCLLYFLQIDCVNQSSLCPFLGTVPFPKPTEKWE